MRPADPPVAIVRTIAGPWGPLHLAATDRGIVAGASAVTRDAFDAGLVHRLRGSVEDEAGADAGDPRRDHLDRAERIIASLLRAEPPEEDVRVDLADRPPWDRHVLAAVRDVPWGRTASYGEIARRVGSPRAARAVGGAVGRNPVTLLIPCHRIIASDGTIGGYGADAWGSDAAALSRKRELLLREGTTVADRAG